MSTQQVAVGILSLSTEQSEKFKRVIVTPQITCHVEKLTTDDWTPIHWNKNLTQLFYCIQYLKDGFLLLMLLTHVMTNYCLP